MEDVCLSRKRVESDFGRDSEAREENNSLLCLYNVKAQRNCPLQPHELSVVASKNSHCRATEEKVKGQPASSDTFFLYRQAPVVSPPAHEECLLCAFFSV